MKKIVLVIGVILLMFGFTGAFVIADDKNNENEPGFYNFVLLKGKGVEVCEAYLERLKKTYFDNFPFCDRPENVEVEGFEKLNRVDLTPEEIYPIKYLIEGFMRHNNQFLYIENAKSDSKYGYAAGLLRPENKEKVIGYIKQGLSFKQLGAYRYDPPISFDNDATTDNLIVWKQLACGTFTGTSNFPQRGLTVVLVLAPDSLSVDEAETKRFVGHPVSGYPKPDGKSFYDKFRPIGLYMGIFRYKGITYFDTFFDGWGDFEGKRRDTKQIANTLGVFVREKGKTKQICEYLWEDPDKDKYKEQQKKTNK